MTKEKKEDMDPRVFQQGAFAKQNAVSKDDAPYDPSDHNYKTWLKGWESVEV